MKQTCAMPSQWDWDIKSDRLGLELLGDAVTERTTSGKIGRNTRERAWTHQALEQAMGSAGAIPKHTPAQRSESSISEEK